MKYSFAVGIVLQATWKYPNDQGNKGLKTTDKHWADEKKDLLILLSS